jgi:hypothetical protein
MRLWAVWVIVSLSLDRGPGENGDIPADPLRVLVFVVIELYKMLHGRYPTAVSKSFILFTLLFLVMMLGPALIFAAILPLPALARHRVQEERGEAGPVPAYLGDWDS